MKKIIFATDFSETCVGALDYLISLVKEKDATIDLIHVYGLPVSTISVSTPEVIHVILAEKKKIS